jgi:hypothetical protein
MTLVSSAVPAGGHGSPATRPASASALALALAALLTACGNNPPVPDWKLNAQSALERAAGATLEGRSGIAQVEYANARREIARTGRIDLLARAELMRCAAQVASLQFDPCAGFEALRADAQPPELAYAAYLAGRATPADVALLPEAHRAVAAPGASEAATVSTLQAIKEPFARQIAAAVLLQTNRASPGVIAQAIDNASAQGWRRPLLGWLKLQAQRAQAAGDGAALESLQRRITLVESEAR